MNPSIVHIVDDDTAVRDSLQFLLEVRGFRARGWPDAETFLAGCDFASAACLVLDLRMPGLSGIELQAELARRCLDLPIVIVTAHGDVPAARATFRAGASDFLEKPIDPESLVAAIEDAVSRFSARREKAGSMRDARDRIARLTPRERQVVDSTVAGLHNREIANELNISARTVEVYKARAMEKLQVKRIPDLVRLVLDAAGESP